MVSNRLNRIGRRLLVLVALALLVSATSVLIGCGGEATVVVQPEASPTPVGN